MNAEQKQRAVDLIDVTKTYRLDAEECAMQMAALLQELVDAPEPEPVARVTGYYAGYLSIATVDGRVLPTGTALYTAPPVPSVPDVANTFKRRAEEIVAMAVNRENYAKINRTIADLVTDIANAAEAPTPAEVLTTTNQAQTSSSQVEAPESEPFGYFKAEPFGWTDCAETDDGAIALYTAPPAPSVLDMPLSMEQFGGLVGLARDDASEKAIVYKATNIYGETCYFGVKATAQAWAKSGRVDEVRLRDLRVVATPTQPEPRDKLKGGE